MAAQLRDRAGQDVVGDERIGPNGMNQGLSGNNFAGILGQADENPHNLRLEMDCRAIPGEGVQSGLNKPSPDLENGSHGTPDLRGNDGLNVSDGSKG